MTIDGITACIYRPSVKRLDLVVERRSTELADDYVQVNIANFTGVKSYTTTASDSETADTFVQAFGTATDGILQSGASTTLGTCTGPCTVNVTNAGVVSAGPGMTGTLTVEVDCPRLWRWARVATPAPTRPRCGRSTCRTVSATTDDPCCGHRRSSRRLPQLCSALHMRVTPLGS